MHLERSGAAPGKQRRQPAVPTGAAKKARGRGAVRSFFSFLLCAILATAGITTLGVISASAPASALPGNSGVPSDPKVVFLEPFEKGQGATATGLLGYTGVAGQTHTAAPFWVNYSQCNGVILRYENPVFPAGYCSAPGSGGAQENVRRFADVLGQVDAGVVGSQDSTKPVNKSTAATRANHAVADWTASQAGVVDNQVAFETSALSLVAQSTHFYSASVDVVESSCEYLKGVNNSRLRFSLVVGGDERPIVNAAIRACTDEKAQYYTSPVLALGSGWDNGGVSARAGTFYSDSSALLTPAELSGVRVRMRNETSATEGNDFAFDNIRLLDVTPQLDKAFSPETITQGQSTTLTYTVTNTSELGAKKGWRFVDNLPAGLTATGSLGGTCVRTAGTATAGFVDVTGNLAAGSASCTITVGVTSNEPGKYNNSGCVANDGAAIPNCTNNFPTITGLYPPGTAPLTVLPVIGLSITKKANLPTYTPGSPITYTVAVHNAGPSDAIDAVLTDPLPDTITDATWTCAVTAEGTPTLPPTSPPTKTKCAEGGTGNVSDTVRINTGGTIEYTITGTVAVGTTGNLVNKATVVPAKTTPVPNKGGGGPNPIPGSTTPVTTIDPNCPPSPLLGCSADVSTPASPIWDIKKTATVNGSTPATNVVKAGDVITYSVTATGISGLITNAVLTDNLSDVLDDATFLLGSATLKVGAAASVPVPNPVAPANILTTGKFSLPAGTVATLSYQVTVKNDVWNKNLINVVTGAADTPPSHCVAGAPVQPDCTTTHLTPAKVLIQKIGESGTPDAGWVPMEGSSWAVYNDDGGTQGGLLASPSVEKVPGEQGRFQLAGVPVGTYWLVETAAPEGFNLLAEPVQFTIAANGAVSIGQGAGGGVVTAGISNSDGIYLVTVRDVPALQLPESGGGGTLPFMLGGSFLLLAATALALGVQRRRQTLRSETV